MSQTKTPSWERKPTELTALEEAIGAMHYIIGSIGMGKLLSVEKAWSELQALQAVAEALREWVAAANAPSDVEMSDVSDAWDKITDALRELEALCQR